MNLIDWLLAGDIAIKYQTQRDLLDNDDQDLRRKITSTGFASKILSLQQEDGHWGGGYYHYKWINTHYSLMELRRLNIVPTTSVINVMNDIADNYKTKDGGITPNPDNWEFSDVCINGMSLFIMCYFGIAENKLESVIDFIITQQLKDGGFNCHYNYKKYGAKHSSLHSTVSLIEGFNSYISEGYKYRVDEIMKIRKEAIEFLLIHQLYISDRTGEIINNNFLKLSYPPRWKYDILRALEALVNAEIKYDNRLDKAIAVIKKKQRKDGTWPVQNKHQGKTHFDMEKTGGSSRWNTLRVLRVFKHFQISY